MQPKTYTLPFIKKEQVAKDTYMFFFYRSKEEFSFLPGQYIRMILPHEQADERGTSRYFSITTSPSEKEHVAITTKIIAEPSSFKKTLSNLLPGTPVQFFGPNGNFVLREEETQPHILLAGGIGITPFYSMFSYAVEKKLTIPLYLFVSFSTVEEAVWYETFKAFAQQNPALHPIYTITHPEESQTPWDGETGRISMDLVQKYTQEIQSALFYLVGPPKMVTAMEEMVKEAGVSPEQIRKENFTGY